MALTLNQIKAQIESLKIKRDRLHPDARNAAIKQILELMADFGIAQSDLTNWRHTPRGLNVKSKGGKRGPVETKYRNSETGDTWSGRGRAPRWLVAAESAGATRAQFLVTPSTVFGETVEKGTTARNNINEAALAQQLEALDQQTKVA